jgi:hypothetical protein
MHGAVRRVVRTVTVRIDGGTSPTIVSNVGWCFAQSG